MENIDRFVAEKNIERYKKLVTGTLTGIQRLTILTLLAEEEMKYRNLPKSGVPIVPKENNLVNRGRLSRRPRPFIERAPRRSSGTGIRPEAGAGPLAQ
jgi:hypothetical protein